MNPLKQRTWVSLHKVKVWAKIAKITIIEIYTQNICKYIQCVKKYMYIFLNLNSPISLVTNCMYLFIVLTNF